MSCPPCPLALASDVNQGLDTNPADNEKRFQTACKEGNLSRVMSLHGADSAIIKLLLDGNQTPLHLVAEGTGSVEVADYLINEGVNTDIPDINGNTVFHIACKNGKLDLVKFLHQKYPTLKTSVNKDNQTPLHNVAIGTGSVDVADYLINEGVDIQAKDANGDTAFHEASKGGHLKLLKLLNEKCPNIITLVNKNNDTPLHYLAGGTGSVAVAEYLINEGVDVHATDSKNGVTVFHVACYKGHLDLVNFLHNKYPAMMTRTIIHNQTPLHRVAFGTGSVDVANYLICEGVDIQAKYSNVIGITTCHIASYRGHLELVKSLHKKDPSMISILDNENRTTLYCVALGTGSVDLADYLINEGVDILARENVNGNTVFHTASKNGHLDLIQFLHRKDSTLIKMSNKHNQTPLHRVAFGTGSVDVAEYLIQEGVDVQARSENGNTALHLASEKGHLDLIKFLHRKDSTLIKLSNKHNQTPLHHVAFGTGSVDVAEYLINEGVDIEAKSKNDISAIDLASKKGHLDLVKYLHRMNPTMVILKNKHKQTQLHFVADGTGSIDVANYLIDEGVDIQANYSNGITYCHLASYRGHLELVKLLHKKDPSMISMVDNENRTTLYCVALGTGSVDMADYLVNEGVNVLAKENVNGDTVFHIACQNGHLDLVKFLHQKYPDLITLTNKNNKTALHYVGLGTGSVEMAKYLVDEGVDVHAKTRVNGDTVFHKACYKGHLDLVRFLHQKYPAMINLTNKYHQTPLHYVAGIGSVDVADYLINAGLDIHTTDIYGNTVFHVACENGLVDFVKFLYRKDSTMIELKNRKKRTPLYYAANCKTSTEMTEFFAAESIDLQKHANNGSIFMKFFK